MNELTVEECLKRAEFAKMNKATFFDAGASSYRTMEVESYWRRRAQELQAEQEKAQAEAQEKSKPKRLCILCGRKRPERHRYLCEDCFQGGYYTLIANAPSAEKEKA